MLWKLNSVVICFTDSHVTLLSLDLTRLCINGHLAWGLIIGIKPQWSNIIAVFHNSFLYYHIMSVFLVWTNVYDLGQKNNI